jgi:uncharacterized protein
MIVDTHIHVWPDKIAKAALGNPKEDLKRFGDGTVASAEACMREAGIDRSVCLAVANEGKRVESANRFVGSLDRARFVPFGTVHPDLPVEENLASLRAHDIHGAKIHPLFQGYALDDKRLWEIFEAMSGEFAIIVHVGEGGSPEANARCTPAMLREVALNFPRLDIVACHFGGYRLLEEAEELVVGLPIHLDTSWPPSLGVNDPARIRRLIERHGPERVLFATDWPMADPAREVEVIEGLGLSDADTAAVLGGNAERLLKLSPEA